MQDDFFGRHKKDKSKKPLADLVRPKSLKDFFGQSKIVGKQGPIQTMMESDDLVSMIFWGPPGCGKTTLARIISEETMSYFVQLSAVSAGKDDVRKVIKSAKEIYQAYDGKQTILFLDEIHRFNKAQQDFLLPYVEDGTIILIGASTENPSFEVNSALLSRTRVFVFEKLSERDLADIIKRAIKLLKAENSLDLKIDKQARDYLIKMSNGDSRSALNTLELAIKIAVRKKGNVAITKKNIEKALQQSMLYFDKSGEEHYNIISALHKSMRSSDVNASLYWLARMLEAGEDPKYLSRRMTRFAAEDIGNADPQASVLAVACFDAVEKIGLPECKVHLAQLAIYLAKAPKDNSAYVGYKKASQDAKDTLNLPVPLHLRNAPTKLMKSLDYGKGYKYDHDMPDKKSGQQCMPDKLKDRSYLD